VSEHHNPYAAALDGLVLNDPVSAFFDFCREREAVRIRRESGAEAPWSDDPILQRGRFLNIFREDDRGSKAIFRFVAPATDDLPGLIQALFFARWCNKQSTLDALSATQLSSPVQLQHTLNELPDPPWCNVAAYPVSPISWQGRVYSRLDAATELFAQIKGELTQMIMDAQGDVVRATQSINAHFKMANDFPIFMAVMDVAWFRPDVIDPASHVPTGIGAVAFLDRLQAHLGLADHHQTCEAMIALQSTHWPEAKRPFQPIDIEYLSCECRKYYSYLNGTKQFEGKNRFTPGQSARLHFDITAKDHPHCQTHIHVIAGGPCAGKTTLLRALEQAGHAVVPETSRIVLEAGIAAGRTAEELRSDPAAWQMQILDKDHTLFESLQVDQPVFTDTSFIEDLVFSQRAGITVGPNTQQWLLNKRYKTVFFLEPLGTYARSAVRIETQQASEQISAEVRKQYEGYGYQLICVPAVSVAERLAFITQVIAEQS
jgi:predicted ATPase